MKNKTKQLIIRKVRRHGHFTCERTTSLNMSTNDYRATGIAGVCEQKCQRQHQREYSSHSAMDRFPKVFSFTCGERHKERSAELPRGTIPLPTRDKNLAPRIMHMKPREDSRTLELVARKSVRSLYRSPPQVHATVFSPFVSIHVKDGHTL